MKRYNIRVYALIEWEGKILVTDEYRMGMRMTKFPGGGHEWGEGIAQTVIRECMEELGQEPVSVSHFYTTDFFIASAFREEDQLISIYFKAILPAPWQIPTADMPFAFPEETDGAQVFRWISEAEISPEDFTFPIDKKVAELIRAAH
jgi:ADP-ribose pyrophosphatase YjhB (NUDIX family)